MSARPSPSTSPILAWYFVAGIFSETASQPLPNAARTDAALGVGAGVGVVTGGNNGAVVGAGTVVGADTTTEVEWAGVDPVTVALVHADIARSAAATKGTKPGFRHLFMPGT